jgi:hypothetical protein
MTNIRLAKYQNHLFHLPVAVLFDIEIRLSVSS